MKLQPGCAQARLVIGLALAFALATHGALAGPAPLATGTLDFVLQEEDPGTGDEPQAEEPKPGEEPQPGEETPPAEEPKPTEEPPAEEPKGEEPKGDEPKGDEPKGEKPEKKEETPKAEEPKTDELKKEEPKSDEARPEEPKSEEPKAEEPKPEPKGADEEMKPEGAEEEQPAEEEKAEKPESKEETPEAPAELPEKISFGDFVVIPKGGIYGRAAIQVDPIEAALASGKWKTPKPGDNFTPAEGRTLKWRAAKMDSNGVLATQSIAGGGYAVAQIESPAAGIMLLRASGHAAVYVNGELRAGDVYRLGDFDLPVELRKGTNELVFHVYQPELHAELVRPESPVVLVSERAVVPTPVAGSEERVWIGLPVVNASSEPIKGAKLVATAEGGESIETSLPWTDAATFYHASLEVAVPSSASGESLPVTIELKREEETLASQRLELSLVGQGEIQVCTFRSKIDGSVQSYAIRPASETSAASDLVTDDNSSGEAKGAIVALHGIGTSAREFIDHYSAKSWAHVIAPTGRGNYGFDWEDWSRDDVLEALDDAEARFAIDPDRVYLSGYAAGGHGALVLGASEPGRFAAIATSGAWSTLWTYGGGMPQYADPTPPQEMMLRGANPSATDKLMINLRGAGLYVQHGSEDMQVPLAEARVLMESLAAVHDDYKFRERVGEGSWWDDETLDDEETMEFLASRTRQSEAPSVVELATTDLATVSRRDWVGIGIQTRPYELSTLRAERKGDRNPTIEIRTENVDRLYIAKGAVPAGTNFTVRIDGSAPLRLRGIPASGEVWFAKRDKQWARVLTDSKLKGPHRSGGFKEVFDNDPVLVYGTKGSAEETAWARAKARFDAESFYYRGGGSLEVIPDTEFKADQDRDRNVVLYGNVDTNGAWPALLSLSPVQVRRDHVQVDLRPESDSALGVLMVRPRPGSDTALVGVVGGTSVEGMRLTSRLRYFMAGVHYPDFVILGPDTLAKGDSDLRAAGFFTSEWEVGDDDLVWRDLAL